MSVAGLATAVVAVRNVLPVPRTWVVPVAVAVAGAIRRPRAPKWPLAIIGQNKPAMLVRAAIGKMIVRWKNVVQQLPSRWLPIRLWRRWNPVQCWKVRITPRLVRMTSSCKMASTGKLLPSRVGLFRSTTKTHWPAYRSCTMSVPKSNTT
ncbi:hypothetical protein D3C87_1473640 [compost metagenome]